jgi:hypothetical protein
MLKRAIVFVLLAGAPLATMAQQADRPNSGPRIISPLPPQAPAPIAKPAITKAEPDNAAQSRAEKSAPPAPVDDRGRKHRAICG